MPRAVVTGAAGFVGSHLCEALLDRGWAVVGYDNFLTGRPSNLADLADRTGFAFVEQDVCEPIAVDGAVDAVLHLASPASPPEYLRLPIETLLVGSRGTQQALDVARAAGARFLLASTSEIYGDPLVHPQPESYWGNVNPAGPRAVYDEAKRFAEAISMAYHRTFAVDVKIVRIFNTYGPRLAAGDGRVVSNFLMQALRGEPLTVYGDGTQTRSFCFVDDEVRGILALLESDWTGPMNIGNPDELSVLQLAKEILEVTGSDSPIVHRPLPTDDPRVRRPDIDLARRVLGWEPEVSLRDGLSRMADWYRGHGEL
jgi:dTDP-glucose 4,6-dehydratase